MVVFEVLGDEPRQSDPLRLTDLGVDRAALGMAPPLVEIAEVCRRHRVWLHVDAAHGGSACLSRKYRHLVAGLDQADSVVWDAHKMMFMPALCAFVFYRDPAHRFAAFQQDAPYLFDPSVPGIADYDSALKTVECTKRAAAMGLWGVWSLFGPQLFGDMVDVTFDLGRALFDKLQEEVKNIHGRFGIQVARRLVSEQQPRLRREGTGQRHPLLLAAGELRWVVVAPLAETHGFEQLVGTATAPRLVVEAVDDPRLGHDIAHPEARVDRGIGVLVDQLHVLAHLAQVGAIEGEEVLPQERRAAGIGGEDREPVQSVVNQDGNASRSHSACRNALA